jgi:hypothetical protein
VKKSAYLLSAGMLVVAAHALAADSDAALEAFRGAYTSGKGLSYVVINDEKGERVYRYGDASREAAKKDKDKRGFMLFTCLAPHVFVADSVSDRAALAKATVVHAGEPRFAELDAKYVNGCRNPLVKSAVPAK